MSVTAEQLFENAQALDRDERIALAERLLESDTAESEVFAAHSAVAHERLEEMLSGKVAPVAREDTLRQVQELIGKGSAA